MVYNIRESEEGFIISYRTLFSEGEQVYTHREIAEYELGKMWAFEKQCSTTPSLEFNPALNYHFFD